MPSPDQISLRVPGTSLLPERVTLIQDVEMAFSDLWLT